MLTWDLQLALKHVSARYSNNSRLTTTLLVRNQNNIGPTEYIKEDAVGITTVVLRTHTWPGDLRLNSYRYSRTPGRTSLMYLVGHVRSYLGVEVHQPTSRDGSLGIPLGIQGGSICTKVLYKSRSLPIR
jgi:hypothetical protein